jgi:PAS domain S-box-containing protein
LAGQNKFLAELRLRHKNGGWRYCETVMKALRDADGNLTTLVATTRDITNWKLAQFALRESEEKYRSLVESSDAMIAIVNRQGQFTFVNDKRAHFFGWDKHDIIGKTARDFYEPGKADLFYARVQRVFEEKIKFVYEYQAVYREKEHWLRASLMPVFDSAGEVNLVMISTIDITGIKFSEDALRKQNDTLKQIAFLQSHIVRSPLTNIQGILYLLNEDGMDEENRFYFRLLKQAAEKLDEIVKEIVDKAILIKRQTTDTE